MTQRKPAKGKGGMRSRNTASPARQGVAAKELLEARKRKRHREVIRNRIIFGTICAAILLVAVLIITKMGVAIFDAGPIPTTSTLTFQEDGQVVFEEVTDFDPEVYSKSELKTYTKDLIKEFNEKHEEAITLKRFKVKDNQAYIKTIYKDAKTYTEFTGYETFNGSYDDAVSSGYNFEAVFSAVANNAKSAGQTVDAASTFAGSKVAVVKENVKVVVPGNIKYVSEPSTELADGQSINIKQQDGNEDATDLVYIIYSK